MSDTPWKVLSVDDDSEIHENLINILSSRMGDNNFQFTTVSSFDEGLQSIREGRYDLIFLDVHEDKGDPDPAAQPQVEDQRGEELLQTLKKERFVPVVFYTGFPDKVDHLKSPVVKIVEKGAPIDEVRDAVNAILDTKLPHLSRHIEEQSRAYIWDSLDGVFDNPDFTVEPTDLTLLTARNLAQSLSQKVVKELIGHESEQINPLEMYQFPPVEKTCNPADIYKRKNDDSLWMILTPACDFEQDKADNVLLARIIPIVEHDLYQAWVDANITLRKMPPDEQKRKDNKKPVNIAMGEVKNLVKGRKGERYKFLPGTFFLPDCVVDFQDLVNHPKEEAEQYDQVCSLDNPYREELLHLFSKYYGRIGTPDYSTDKIWAKVDAQFTEQNR